MIAKLPSSSLFYAPIFLCSHCINFHLCSFPLLHYSFIFLFHLLIFLPHLSSSILIYSASLYTSSAILLQRHVIFCFVFIYIYIYSIFPSQVGCKNSTFNSILFTFVFFILDSSSSRPSCNKHSLNNPWLFFHHIPLIHVQFLLIFLSTHAFHFDSFFSFDIFNILISS